MKSHDTAFPMEIEIDCSFEDTVLLTIPNSGIRSLVLAVSDEEEKVTLCPGKPTQVTVELPLDILEQALEAHKEQWNDD